MRVRIANGELVPLQAVADVELITAPSSIIRYNNLRSVVLNGGPAPGYSSGEAIAAMETLAKTHPAARLRLSNGPARRCRRRRRRARPASSSALAVVFAYLFLVGLYESTAIPVAALLSVVGRPVRRHGWRCCSAASTTTSSPRSASSC